MAKTKKQFGPTYKKYEGERGSAEQWVSGAKKVFGLDKEDEVEEPIKVEEEEESDLYQALIQISKKGKGKR